MVNRGRTLHRNYPPSPLGDYGGRRSYRFWMLYDFEAIDAG